MFVFYFLFFKQKTAYEMRISDWSSDVCSSDLPGLDLFLAHDGQFHRPVHLKPDEQSAIMAFGKSARPFAMLPHTPRQVRRHARIERAVPLARHDIDRRLTLAHDRPWIASLRSEEHTSELQSLMRISYAVLCLKKKKAQQCRRAS